MTQLLNLLETETLDISDQAILNQDGIDKRISLQLAGVLSWAEMNGFTYSGEYTDDPTILTSTAFVYFEGSVYFASESASLPYNTDSTAYATPEDDTNLYKALEYNTVNNNIGTGSTNYAAGDHTHVQADITDLSDFIKEVIEDPSPTLGGDLNTNGNYITDLTGNGVRISSEETSLIPRSSKAHCQLHVWGSEAETYPSGVAGFFINSMEEPSDDAFYVKKVNNSTVIQLGSEVDDNTLGVFMPMTAYSGLGVVVTPTTSQTPAITNGKSEIHIYSTTGSCEVTIETGVSNANYYGNIKELIFLHATSRSIINNTGKPILRIKEQTTTTIANGDALGVSRYNRLILTNTAEHILISFD